MGIEFLHRQSPSEEDRRQAEAIIEEQMQQLLRLVDDLLDLSRIGKGKLQLCLEPVDVAFAVRSALESCRPLITAAGHDVTLKLNADPLMVNADRGRLTQVFSNLITNAGRYTPDGGRIHVSAAAEQGEAVISIQDNGIGIPSEALPDIFERFAQARNARHHFHGGLGIGLALVKEIVELHGGRVEAVSAGTGQGSQFIVRLPLVECSVAPPPLRAA
jgi:signal transduction histidine kinase